MQYIEIGKKALAAAGGVDAFVASKAPAALVGFSVDNGMFHFIFSAPPPKAPKSAKD